MISVILIPDFLVPRQEHHGEKSWWNRSAWFVAAKKQSRTQCQKGRGKIQYPKGPDVVLKVMPP